MIDKRELADLEREYSELVVADETDHVTCGLGDLTRRTQRMCEITMLVGDDLIENWTHNALAQIKRPDFDLTCECGYYQCRQCDTPWYPMEVDEQPSECPGCLGELTGLIRHDKFYKYFAD